MSRLGLLAAALAACSAAEPTIESTTRLGATTDTLGPYTVVSLVRETADGDLVELRYSVGAVDIPRAMTGDGDRFQGAIPGQPAGTEVRYHVAVLRDGDEVARDPRADDDPPFYAFEIVAPP